MAGYLRKLISLEQALKEAIRDLKDRGLKEATNKSESHFRKCSDEKDKDHNIHHKDSIEIDRYCMKRGLGHPMLTSHQTILDAADKSITNVDSGSNTFINFGSRIGRLMDTTQKAMDPEGEEGQNLSQKEKDHIHKAIKEVEDKILNLKMIVDNS